MTTHRLKTRIHPDDRIDPGKSGPHVMRHVTVNVAESPIVWLAARGRRRRTRRWRGSTRTATSMPRSMRRDRGWPTFAGG